jgi:hypothetical protein
MSDVTIAVDVAPVNNSAANPSAGSVSSVVDPPKFVQHIQLNVNLEPVASDLHNPNQVLADQVFDVLKLRTPLTHANIIEIVGVAIQMTERLRRGKEMLTNNEKKSIVTYLIRRLVNEAPMDDDLRSYFTNVFIPVMLSGVIDSLCSLDVHELQTSLLACCCAK